jgi:hypothetical protein
MPADEDTRVEELPPYETGTVPVKLMETEPRWYGITPEGAVLAVGLAAAGVGVSLLALGSPLVGALVLAAGLVVLAGLVRRPVAAALSGPAEMGRTALTTRMSAGKRLAGLRGRLDAIHGERDERLRALGEAVYRDDEEARDSLRQELEELDRRGCETSEEIDRTVFEARERMRNVRIETARTEAVSLEPYPPPGEADPPQQPRIPEPYPPPDEGEPPEQPRIPETSPEPPEQPPENENA